MLLGTKMPFLRGRLLTFLGKTSSFVYSPGSEGELGVWLFSAPALHRGVPQECVIPLWRCALCVTVDLELLPSGSCLGSASSLLPWPRTLGLSCRNPGAEVTSKANPTPWNPPCLPGGIGVGVGSSWGGLRKGWDGGTMCLGLGGAGMGLRWGHQMFGVGKSWEGVRKG